MPEPASDAETRTLISYLDAQRRHVLGILDGLSDEDLRRPVLPSGWTCLGLVNHLALDVERFWFQGTVAGEPMPRGGTPDNAWIVAPDVPVAAVFDLYRRESETGNATIAATPLDAPLNWWWPDSDDDWRQKTVREIVLHVITETAAHAGHLDIVRELIDGRSWLVMP